MRFRILGPVRVEAAGHEIAITARRERTLLAVLLLHDNQPVPCDELIDLIWSTRIPHHPRNQLQRCVHHLRRRLAEAGIDRSVIVTEPTGYRLTVDPGNVDLPEFRRHVTAARTATRAGLPDVAVDQYRAALALWRGPALADVPSPRVRGAAAALDEERHQALEERIAAELTTTSGGDLISELTDLVRQHPHRERLHRALMLALYRAGRPADALAAYRSVRQLLRDELGIDPGDDLQDLYQAIRRRDPLLDQPSPAVPARTRPRELPPGVAAFTGRGSALKMLEELLPDGDHRSGPRVATITGSGGIGKTALALHWAHRVADRFPDGQLFLDLRGYASGAPVPPIEALSALLRSLGAPPDQTPLTEPEASARYREVLADRRVLVVLDNARSADQVLPLLPDGSGCLTLVTSRDRLADLGAQHPSGQVTLDVLAPDEAYALLAGVLGAGRIDAEPAAATALAAACVHLPLALRIAAAILDDHPDGRIATLVAELTAGQRLTALAAAGDEETAVRATFDLSYRAVPPPAQRLFRLLGLVPGPDVTPAAAAALADLPGRETHRLLDRLAGAHLVNEHLPGRYTYHDLLREYARERAGQEESGSTRSAVLARLIGWYERCTVAAIDHIRPGAVRLPQPEAPASGAPVQFPGPDAALAWLDAERPNLLPIVQQAAESGPRRLAWLLVDCLRFYFRRRPGTDALAVANAGWRAAQAEGDPSGRAASLLAAVEFHFRRGDDGLVLDVGQRALASSEQCGWHEGQRSCHTLLTVVHMDAGRLRHARNHAARAVALSRRVGQASAQASSLSVFGQLERELGNLANSERHSRRALAMYRNLADPVAEAISMINLAELRLLRGRPAEALDLIAGALRAFQGASHPAAEAEALRVAAQAHCVLGEPGEALKRADAALKLVATTGDRREVANIVNVIATIQLGRGDHREALAHYTHALELAGTDGLHPRIEALLGLAMVALLAGQHEPARDKALAARDAAHRAGYRVLADRARTCLAEIRLGQHQLDDARDLAEPVLADHRTTGYRLGEAQTLAVLGRIRQAQGDRTAAVQHHQDAAELFQTIGAPLPAESRECLPTAE